MSFECDKCSESADMYSAFTSPEELLEDIKFYQWEWNKENQIEKVLCYGDYCEVFDMLKS